jgi:trans-aconitate methyltransferase
VDGSAAMIAQAQTHFPAQRWIHRDMRHLTMDETFDGLIAWDSFFI